MAVTDGELLRLEAARDCVRLTKIYDQAACEAERAGDTDRACFFWTHAYIWALEGGLDDAVRLRGKLAAFGREVAA